MQFALFYHSLYSDWNHGNAHFLRGVVTELLQRGHDVRVYEPRDGWSLQNLLAEHGQHPMKGFRASYPSLSSHFYDADAIDLDAELDDVDAVLVHEWNEPEFVARIGQHRRTHGGYRLLFHDTHHRSVTAPEQMQRYDLTDYDGVLVFGQVIEEIYRDRGWADRVWTWHEAADLRVFHPREPAGDRMLDLVWIGNWGDGERSAELVQYLVAPVGQLGLSARVHGVRYPEEGRQVLASADIEFAGWLPNYRVPKAFSESRLTVHIPRRPYRELLHGVPTIRVFEALACGIPLICLTWRDSEDLFRPGKDYLEVETPRQMRDAMQTVLSEPELASQLVASGLETIRSRHTCSHRVEELLQILNELAGPGFDASEEAATAVASTRSPETRISEP